MHFQATVKDTDGPESINMSWCEIAEGDELHQDVKKSAQWLWTFVI